MHEEGPGHATPRRRLSDGPGVERMLQAAPSQRSVSGWRFWRPLEVKFPAAMHEPSLAHETAERTLEVAPTGFGLGWMTQLAVGDAVAEADPITVDMSARANMRNQERRIGLHLLVWAGGRLYPGSLNTA
jgi:hypothetical protein